MQILNEDEKIFNPNHCFKVKAHDLNIESISVDSQEKFILTCSRDKTIKLWGLPQSSQQNEQELIHRSTFHNHKSAVISIKPVTTFYKNSFFLSLSTDESIKVWDFSKKLNIKTMKLFGTFGRDSFYIIKSIDLFTGDVCNEFKGHSDVVMSINVFEKLKLLVSASRDKSIAFWSLDTKKSLNKPLKVHSKTHKQGITSMIIIEKKNLIITGSNDFDIKIWSLDENTLNLKLVKILKQHKGWILSLCLINESYFASSSSDDTVKIWSLPKMKCVQDLQDLQENMFSPSSIVFMEKTKLLLVGDKNGDLRGWELN